MLHTMMVVEVVATPCMVMAMKVFVAVEEAATVVVVTKFLAKYVARPTTPHSVVTNALMQATIARRNMSIQLQQDTM
jgi:hypothetical protein